MLPILKEHNGQPIGLVTHIESTKKGIFIKFKTTEQISGFLSIGFKTIKCLFKNNIRYLQEIEILEISVVEKPVQHETTIKEINGSNRK